jgi:hypothetical protein
MKLPANEPSVPSPHKAYVPPESASTEEWELPIVAPLARRVAIGNIRGLPSSPVHMEGGVPVASASSGKGAPWSC